MFYDELIKNVNLDLFFFNCIIFISHILIESAQLPYFANDKIGIVFHQLSLLFRNYKPRILIGSSRLPDFANG
jgi:hypothetical protein